MIGTAAECFIINNGLLIFVPFDAEYALDKKGQQPLIFQGKTSKMKQEETRGAVRGDKEDLNL